MITSFEVGAIFKIVDGASLPLANIARELGKLDSVAKTSANFLAAVAKSLGSIDTLGPTLTRYMASLALDFGRIDKLGPTLARGMLGLATELGNLDKAAAAGALSVGALLKELRGIGRMSRSRHGLAQEFDKSAISIDRAKDKVALLIGELKTAATAAHGIRVAPNQIAAAHGVGRPQGYGRAGLAHGAGGGGGGSGHISQNLGFNAGQGPHGAGMGLGMGGFIGAAIIGKGVADIIKDGAHLTHVQEQMIQAGMTQKEIAESTAAAWKAAAANGLSVVKVLEDIKELRFPLGSTQHAIDFIDPLEKMRVVLNSVNEGSGNSARDAAYKMARAGELKGLNTPEEFYSYFNNMTKAISATGGKVTPNDYAQFTKYAGISAMGQSEDFYTKYAPSLIQAFGASSAGTAGMSLFSTISQGKATGKSVKQFAEDGLIGDESKIVYNNAGDIKGMRAGAVVDNDMFVKNPFEWIKTYMLPMLEKKFGTLDNSENKAKAVTEIGELFGNRTAAKDIGEMVFRSKNMDRDAGFVTQSRGIEGAVSLLKDDPTAVMNKFTTSFNNLATALGQPSVGNALGILNGMSDAMNHMGKIANEHPQAAKWLVGAMEGLAVALGILTAVAVVGALAAFLPGGFIAIGFLAVAAVFGAFVNNGGIKKFFQMFEAVDMAKLDKFDRAFDRQGLGSPSMQGGKLGLDPILTDPKTGESLSVPGLQFKKPDMGMGLKKMSFGSDSSANSEFVEILAQGVYLGMKRLMEGTGASSGGMGGYGGGIIAAAYGNDNAAGGGSPRMGLNNIGSLSGLDQHAGGSVASLAAHRNLRYGGASGGGSMGEGGSRSWRNNNPGNIEFGAYARSMGATGSDGRFSIFPSYESGRRAQEHLLFESQSYKDKSLSAAIGRWAPQSENNTGAYIANLAKAGGIGPGTRMSDISPAARAKILDAMQATEGWRVGRHRASGSLTSGSAAAGAIGLNIKPGADAAGSAYPGVMALAQAIQAGDMPGGFNRFTAFKDDYHEGTASRHAQGLAGDLTLKNPAYSSMAAEKVRDMIRAAGISDDQFRVIDEYRNPSGRATAGHIHYEFKTPNAAAAFAATQKVVPIPPPPARRPAANDAGTPANHHLYLDGQKIAHVVSKHQARGAAHPTSIGGADSRTSYAGPGHAMSDVA